MKADGGTRNSAAAAQTIAIVGAIVLVLLLLLGAQLTVWRVQSEVSANLMVANRLLVGEIASKIALLSWVRGAVGVLVVGLLAYALLCGRREERARKAAVEEARRATEQLELLFRMTEMLQSASGYGDATAVLRATSDKLLPHFGGALYVFNNSRDRLDLCASWTIPDSEHPPQSIAPGDCWALKRGKPHLNGVGDGALCCEHHPAADLWVLEIPMLARGEVYGLIQFATRGRNSEARVARVQPMATAIADGMSLALANIGLREKLRSQALRDSLTGLYNRRYMEDMLERFGHLAERNRTTLAAVMIDLDHFKALNDEHGHATGDAVLRAVATTLMEGLRASDIACRYGGEELLLLMPDCSLEQARAKAEMLRARFEALSEVYGVRVSGSFGVASLFETTKDPAHLLADADAALYAAKQAGRNQVVAAERRIEPLPPIAAAA